MKNIKSIIFVNSITMIRVIGTFLLPIISTTFSAKGVVSYLIILLLTDSIDGILARRLNASTIFGALLDALADKMLGIATLCLLAFKFPIMLLPVMAELAIVLINTTGATKGSGIESSLLGKFKTWIMGISMVLAFLTVYANDFISLINNVTVEGETIIEAFNYLITHEATVINSLSFIMVGADLMVAFDYRIRNKSDAKKAKDNGLVPKNMTLKKGRDLLFCLLDHNYYLKTRNMPLLESLGEERHERKNKRK